MLHKKSMIRLLVIFVLLILFVSMIPDSRAEKRLTIERIFSDPRLSAIEPEGVRWSPDGARFAFLWNAEAKKRMRLWLYDLKSEKLEEILTEDDLEGHPGEIPEEQRKRDEILRKPGEGIGDFLWSPDGTSILIPHHSDLYLFDLRTKMPRRMTKTEKAELDPKFCGSADRIAFVRDNDLWLMDLKNGQTAQLTSSGSDRILNGLSNYIALEELGRSSSFEPSPDGKQIVYVQSDLSPIRTLVIPDYLPRFVSYDTQDRPVAGEKNAVERIGILPAEGGETKWIDLPSADHYILSLRWQGSDVLIRILERNNKVLHLYSYHTDSHVLEELLKEEDGAFVNFHNNFIIPVEKPEGFLWTSERSGYNHLYTYEHGKQGLRKLTDGKWEITDLCGIDKDGKIFFVSTAAEPEQKHLYSLDPGNGKIEKLTDSEGCHKVEFSPDMAHFADIYTDAAHPYKLLVSSTSRPGKMKKLFDSAIQELAEYDPPAIEFEKMKSRDGEEIHYSVMKPSGFKKSGKYPVIVHVHGGGYAQSVEKTWHGIYQLFHYYLAQELKFIIVDVDYRGSSGYGRKFRTDIYLHLGGKDLDDVEDVVGYLKKLPYVDAERIGIWGWSYGGFLTNMAMLKRPDLFKAGAAVAPVNDWRNYDTQYTEERLMTPGEEPEAYKISSPITFAKGLKNHLLMIHGMQDDNVHFQDTVQLVGELIKNSIDFDLMIYPEGKHGISGDQSRIHLFRKIAAHFERYLK